MIVLIALAVVAAAAPNPAPPAAPAKPRPAAMTPAAPRAPSIDAAHALYLRGSFREALKEADAYLSAHSKSGEALSMRARAWHALGEPLRQKKDADRAVDILHPAVDDQDALLSFGNAALMAGRPATALEAFEAAVRASQSSAETLADKGRAERALGRPAQALVDLTAATGLMPGVPLWHYSLGRVKFDLGDIAGAVAEATAALKLNKEFAAAFSLLGTALAKQGDVARAQKAYDRAIALDPDYVYPRLGRAALAFARGDDAGAFAEIETAAKADPDSAAPAFERANALLRLGRRPEAVTGFVSVLGAPKLSADIAFATGDKLMSAGRPHEATAAYGKAAALGGGARALLSRSRAWEALDEKRKALSDAEEAERLEPDTAVVLAAKGALLGRLGRQEEGLRDLSRAIELEPNHADWMVMRGEVYARNGRVHEALQEFNQALHLEPRNATAFAAHGGVLARTPGASLAAAIVDLSHAAQFDPTQPLWRIKLGDLCLRLGNFRRALVAFDEAMVLGAPPARILPRRALARAMLGEHGSAMDDAAAAAKEPKDAELLTQLASWLLAERNPGEAENALGEVLSSDPRDPLALLLRGEAYALQGRLRPAVSDLEKSVKIDPGAVTAWTALCQARRVAGDFKDAMEACDSALALNPADTAALLQRGFAEVALHRYPEAVKDIDAAWSRGARRAEAQLSKSVALAAQRRFTPAHAAYDVAKSLDPMIKATAIGFTAAAPGSPDYGTAIAALETMKSSERLPASGLIVLADALFSAEQFDKAEVAYTKTMQLDGTISAAYAGRAATLLAQDDLKTAMKDLLQAAELARGEPGPRVNLASAMLMKGDVVGAIGELRGTLRESPHFSEAHRRLGDALYMRKEYGRALVNYELAVADDPLDPASLNSSGIALMAVRRFDDAVDRFSRLIQLNPLNDRAYRNRGLAHAATGEYRNAAGDFRLASILSVDPTAIDEYRRQEDEANQRAGLKRR